MEALVTQFADHLQHGSVAYAVIFGFLVACGLGVPLPEDISLVTGGFICHLGKAHLWLMMIVGFLGIISGDSLIYLAGRRVGTKVGKKGTGLLGRIVTPEKRHQVERLFHAHGNKMVMAARFLPGVRAVTFFTAGSARMAYWRFILWDGVAALASAPLLVFVGFYFGDELKVVFEKVRQGQIKVIAVIVAGSVAYILYNRWRAKKAKAREAEEMEKEAQAGKNGANGAQHAAPPDSVASEPPAVGTAADQKDDGAPPPANR